MSAPRVRRTVVSRSGSGPASSTRSGGRGCSTTTRLSGSTGPGWRPTARSRRHHWVAPRRARIPLTGVKRGETFGSLRGERGSGRAGTRRRQPTGPAAPRPDPELDPDRAAEADQEPAARAVSRRRLLRTLDRSTRARARLYAAHPRSRRRDQVESTRPRLEGTTLGRRGLPLLAEPKPRHPDPLVKERREPPRPPPTRQRPDRLQKSKHRQTRRPNGIGPKRGRDSGRRHRRLPRDPDALRPGGERDRRKLQSASARRGRTELTRPHR